MPEGKENGQKKSPAAEARRTSGSPFTPVNGRWIGLAAQILEGGLRRGLPNEGSTRPEAERRLVRAAEAWGFGLRPYLIYCFFFLAAFFFAAFFLAAITVSYG